MINARPYTPLRNSRPLISLKWLEIGTQYFIQDTQEIVDFLFSIFCEL